MCKDRYAVRQYYCRKINAATKHLTTAMIIVVTKIFNPISAINSIEAGTSSKCAIFHTCNAIRDFHFAT